jgi:hypothetical protein
MLIARVGGGAVVGGANLMTPVLSPPFTAVAGFYDTIMRGVPYRSWVEHLEAMFERHAVLPAGRIGVDLIFK